VIDTVGGRLSAGGARVVGDVGGSEVDEVVVEELVVGALVVGDRVVLVSGTVVEAAAVVVTTDVEGEVLPGVAGAAVDVEASVVDSKVVLVVPRVLAVSGAETAGLHAAATRAIESAARPVRIVPGFIVIGIGPIHLLVTR